MNKTVLLLIVYNFLHSALPKLATMLLSLRLRTTIRRIMSHDGNRIQNFCKMRKRLAPLSLFCLLVSLFAILLRPAFINAQEVGAESLQPTTESLPVGIINQTITVPFKPVSAYALVEAGDGSVRQYKALALPNPDFAGGDGSQAYAVASVVPLSLLRSTSSIYFTFFLASVDGDFAATEVTRWTANQVREESVSLHSLQVMISHYEQEIPRVQMANASFENQLGILREKASQIADVDDIIDLKTELDSLKGFDEQKLGELERLQELARHGRNLKEPENVAQLRQNLSEQLFEAARITAFADRAINTKRDMALVSYRRKVNLVKSAEGVDPQALAQEVLRLRKLRQELERRLNIDSGSSNVPTDF